MIRVVLDTNVLVSALLRAGSLPEAVFNLAFDGLIQIAIQHRFSPSIKKSYVAIDSQYQWTK